jgi:hypothetical protein
MEESAPMAVMVVCGVLLAAGMAAGVAWSDRPVCLPAIGEAPSAGDSARRFAWSAALLLLAGVAAGVTVIGAGGRLAMRLLAVTGGDDAQGRLTEAEQVVGRISAGGTVGFIVFTGVFGGVLAAALFLAIRRLLPGGRLGALAFGLGLLVVLGTRIDPLRSDNPDFDLVGPGWLAVLVFSLLAVVFGFSLVGFTARFSAWLPLPSLAPRVLAVYAVPAVLSVGVVVAGALFVVLGGIAVVATRWSGTRAVLRSGRTLLVARLVLAGIVVLALPGAVTAVAHILSR